MQNKTKNTSTATKKDITQRTATQHQREDPRSKKLSKKRNKFNEKSVKESKKLL